MSCTSIILPISFVASLDVSVLLITLEPACYSYPRAEVVLHVQDSTVVCVCK